MKRFLSIFLCLSCFFAAISNVHMAAVDAGVVDWQTTSLQTWPLYTAPAALAALQATQAPQPVLLTATSPFYILNNSPFSPIYPPTAHNVQLPLTLRPTTFDSNPNKKPKMRDIEPTTASPINEAESFERLEQFDTPDPSLFTNDPQLLAAVSRINPEYIVEEIIPIPGKHILSISNNAKINKKPSLKSNLQKIEKSPKSASARLQNSKPTSQNVVVEATGHTSANGVVPQIAFGTYFLPYFAQGQTTGEKTAALILEPHSKAIVGNGGTAVSTPLSRALLKRGRPTNVYFNPESVAIAGVGGKAHAAADLELDLVN